MRKCLLSLALLASAGFSQDISRDLPYISVDIRNAPVAPRTAGGYLLQYELFVTSWYDKDITIHAVDILSGDVLVQKIEGEVIERLFAVNSGQTAVVGPRQTTTLVVSGVANDLPAKLDHRIHFRVAGDSQDTVVKYPGTPVHKDVVRLRPPLRGDSWVAREGPGGNNHHTAGILQFEGRSLVPQRFAIDFNRSWDDGQLAHGDLADLHSYRCYGAEVFAVADARVIFTRDDVPDNPGQAKANALPDTLANLGGNRVVLDLGGGRFASYMHLQPRSIRVKAGDSVHAGDVLALVGNSGAPAPHLHFQVNDGPEPLTSEGLPYTFDSFVRDGKTVADQIPLDGWVVGFESPNQQR
jgi:murein DD-endopeptidase MepM/ murein hydrolase activator NlpD